jgi:hypothetical protein
MNPILPDNPKGMVLINNLATSLRKRGALPENVLLSQSRTDDLKSVTFNAFC